jgi:hypothetical protein
LSGRFRTTEFLVFAGATGIVVLHILDDAFFQPEPGTSAGDHLTALVPVAVAVAAILAYPRLRAGARASIALVFGVLALTGGGIAVAEGMGVGLSGHDYSGLLLIPAGIALIVLGAVTAWRSRKTTGSRTRRYFRRGLIGVAALVVAVEVIFPVALALGLTHRPRKEVTAANFGRPYEEVSLRTSDGLDLSGWYVPSQNGAAVIAFPGRLGPRDEARMLVRHGYGVLMLDMRGQGESEGDPNVLGWDSPKDLAAAIDFLESRPDVEDGRIGGIGFSVGGEQMIQAAAENRALRAVVSEGAGERSIREGMLQEGLGKWLMLPANAATAFAMTIFSGDAPPPSLKDLKPEVLRRRQGAEDALEDPGSLPHGRFRGPAGGVRAARRRVLRRRARGLTVRGRNYSCASVAGRTQEAIYADIDLELSWSEDDLPQVERTKHVHRLHPYLGKFIPQLVEVFLKRYFAPGSCVFDPFVGSGTTLVEANVFGADAVGCDVSAFNCLLSRVKTSRYPLGELELSLRGALEAARRRTGKQSCEPSEWLRKWYAPRALDELLAYREAAERLTPPHDDVARVILARAARSARLTTHFDLDFPRAPTTEPYHCLKHKRECRPVDEAWKFLARYTTDTVRRIREFAPLRTDHEVVVLHEDARTVRLPIEPTGVITSPPYPGLIDYHEQHRYAYELLELGDRREEEIGAAAAGTTRPALAAYVQAMSAAFRNTGAQLPAGSTVLVVVNDSRDLYPAILQNAGLVLEERITRHVNRRTGRRAGEFFEDVLLCRAA